MLGRISGEREESGRRNVDLTSHEWEGGQGRKERSDLDLSSKRERPGRDGILRPFKSRIYLNSDIIQGTSNKFG